MGPLLRGMYTFQVSSDSMEPYRLLFPEMDCQLPFIIKHGLFVFSGKREIFICILSIIDE